MSVEFLIGDCRAQLRTLPPASVQCVVTSPPYFGLRDYGVEGQIGLEPTPAEFVAAMVGVFREVHRVLRDDGTLWLNLGDSYSGAKPGAPGRGLEADGWNRAITDVRRREPPTAGLKPKNLIGIPWRVAFALQDDGWILRQEIIWHKPNPIPESVKDRCTKAHETIFLLTKSPRYFFNAEAIKEAASTNTHARRAKDGEVRVTSKTKAATFNVKNNPSFSQGISSDVLPFRNKRSVWTIGPRPFKGAHFATFPPELPETCIRASTMSGDTVLDPFGGAGTTGMVADRLGRNAILCELNPDYAAMARARIISENSLHLEAASA